MARALIIPRLCAAAAPAGFPYNHRTLAETATENPAAWREVNKASFDAVYGPEVRHFHRDGSPSNRQSGTAERLAAAREFRAAWKPYFDALYGPEAACTCGAA